MSDCTSDPRPSPPPPAGEAIQQIDRIVQRVAELPDRTSPDDWPDAMLVTADELRLILRDELAALLVAVPPVDPKLGWLVARKRDIEPWEVYAFDRYDEAAMFFDAVAAQWSTVYFCRVAHCEGAPLDVTPVIHAFKARVQELEAQLAVPPVRSLEEPKTLPPTVSCLFCGYSEYVVADDWPRAWRRRNEHEAQCNKNPATPVRSTPQETTDERQT